MTHSLLDNPFVTITLKNADGGNTTVHDLLRETKASLFAMPADNNIAEMRELACQVFSLADSANALFFALQDTFPRTPIKELNEAIANFNSISLKNAVFSTYNSCVIALGILSMQENSDLSSMLSSLAKQFMPNENETLYNTLQQKTEFLVDTIAALALHHGISKEALTPNEKRHTLEAELQETLDNMLVVQETMCELLSKNS